MYVTHNPKWLDKYNYNFDTIEDIPDSLINHINEKLEDLTSDNPLVSIIIPACNEVINIFKCISCLSDLDTKIPIEIIVVNNNSTDKTQETIEKLNVNTVFQQIQGWGPARQKGLELAKGKYILLADADCLYPSCWVDEMIEVLKLKDVVCVYGRYSFIAEKGFPRWKLTIIETLKDLLAEIKQIKRPYLNAYGLSYGFHRELGLKIGFIMDQTRGEDGKLCFDLMQYGKVKPVRSNKSRTWTSPRTLQKDGSFIKALSNRIIIEGKKIFSLFTSHAPHDTKAK